MWVISTEKSRNVTLLKRFHTALLIMKLTIYRKSTLDCYRSVVFPQLFFHLVSSFYSIVSVMCYQLIYKSEAIKSAVTTTSIAPSMATDITFEGEGVMSNYYNVHGITLQKIRSVYARRFYFYF